MTKKELQETVDLQKEVIDKQKEAIENYEIAIAKGDELIEMLNLLVNIQQRMIELLKGEKGGDKKEDKE